MLGRLDCAHRTIEKNIPRQSSQPLRVIKGRANGRDPRRGIPRPTRIMLRAINKYFARKRSRKVLPTKTLFVSDKTDAEPAAVEPAGRPPSPYGFPGADFEVAFFDLARPEEYLDRSHYDGFHPGSSVLPAGHLKKEGLRALPCAMVYERDVEIIMRDGTKLYADVFRPVTDAKVSAILP